MNRNMPGLPVHHQLPEFTQTHVHRVGDAIQPSHPLSSLLLLSPIPPSIRVFSNESTLHMRWPKYWSFSFSISPSNEHPGLISFRMDWFYLLAVQGTLKSLLQHQHHSSKASVLQCSAFFIVQLSHPYRPFRYDLNQIPYDYTVEMRNRFKGLDLIDECLMNCGQRFMTLYRRQGSRPSPRKRNAKKQNGCLGRPYK